MTCDLIVTFMLIKDFKDFVAARGILFPKHILFKSIF